MSPIGAYYFLLIIVAPFRRGFLYVETNPTVQKLDFDNMVTKILRVVSINFLLCK